MLVGEREDTASALNLLDGTVSALSWESPKVQALWHGTAQSFGSFSAPRNGHMTAHGGGSAAAGEGRLSELLTLTAQAVPDISRQTFITFRP